MKQFLVRYFPATKVHIGLAVFWALLAIPGITLWNKSILFVIAVSLYANFVGHISSYQAAASAGVDQSTHDKLNAIADALAHLMELSDSPKLQPYIDELRHTVGIEKQVDRQE